MLAPTYYYSIIFSDKLVLYRNKYKSNTYTITNSISKVIKGRTYLY